LPLHDAMPGSTVGPTKQPGLSVLGWALLCIGAVAFGGLGATLALLRRELVERRGWLRPSDTTDALAYTKPGHPKTLNDSRHSKRTSDSTTSGNQRTQIVLDTRYGPAYPQGINKIVD